MLQKLTLNKNQKGFTLIELMIVIAIIGILAAIAIPQFAAYRIRSFNSSGLSDIRNIQTSEAAFFSDWQLFGGSGTVAAANPQVWGAFAIGAGNGASLYGPSGLINTPANIPCIQLTIQATNRGLQIGLGNNVELITNTGATNASFTAISKHFNGNTYFAADSDITAIYNDEFTGQDGVAMNVAALQASAPGADNFNAVAGPSGNNWVMK